MERHYLVTNAASQLVRNISLGEVGEVRHATSSAEKKLVCEKHCYAALLCFRAIQKRKDALLLLSFCWPFDFVGETSGAEETQPNWQARRRFPFIGLRPYRRPRLRNPPEHTQQCPPVHLSAYSQKKDTSQLQTVSFDLTSPFIFGHTIKKWAFRGLKWTYLLAYN